KKGYGVRGKEVTSRGDLFLENEQILPTDYGHLDHGYCLTSHATQGRTVDRTFNAVGEKSLPAATRESFYVTNSRSRELTKTFTHDVEEYREAVTGERQRLSALELVSGEQTRMQEKEPERNWEIDLKEPADLPVQSCTNITRPPSTRNWEPATQPIEPEHDYTFER